MCVEDIWIRSGYHKLVDFDLLSRMVAEQVIELLVRRFYILEFP